MVTKLRSNWALIILLVITGVSYTWNLAAAGYGNDFYGAAIQAGSESWKAMLFASTDASNFTTVDKPAASFWLMMLSVRIFGLSSYSMLIPQVLLGLGTITLMYSAIKRWFGFKPAFIAALILALTPVFSLMFRFNNPDAALVFLEVLGAYFATRAIEKASTKWIVLTGVAVGFAFLAKELQAMLVVPALALAYSVSAPTKLVRRIWQLLLSGVAMVVSAGWWLLLVQLWPASSRPYIGGSTNNNISSIILGGNGVSRITGESTGGGGGGANFSGATGPFRLFNDLMGGEASWLLPAAIILTIASVAFVVKTPRINKAKAATLLWGGWLVVTAIVLSFAKGTIHTYYTVALTPAIGAMVGIVGARVWDTRKELISRVLLTGTVAITGAWSFLLLNQYSDWHPWLRYAIAVATLVAVLGLVADIWFPRLRKIVAAVIIVACLVGPASYTLSNLSTGETGSIPTSGPITGGFGGGGGTRTADGGGFGHGSGSEVSDELVTMLKANAGDYRWVAAAISSSSSAPLQLASEEPVMSIGGFAGSDNNITLAQFQAYVAAGEIHYYVAGGGGMGGGGFGGGGSSEITTWVEANYTATTVGSYTVYDLTAS